MRRTPAVASENAPFVHCNIPADFHKAGDMVSAMLIQAPLAPQTSGRSRKRSNKASAAH